MADNDATVPQAVYRAEATPLLETRYEVLETLGRGGMGEVVSARDRVLGREIAIKRMIETAPSASEVNRFLREARIQGWLDHPAIPPLHELALDPSGQPYFVMKKLVGTTLADVLEAIARGDAEIARKFPRERLLRAFTEVCLAVEFAHTRGVLHRDIKPANIMLGEFGEVFVLDWGVAKLVGVATEIVTSIGEATLHGAETMAGAVVGTPSFMAPEQRAGSSELDGRADVYSLGRVLHTILRPSLLLETELRPSPSPPPELEEVARVATAVDRDQRIATPRELADRVQKYLDGDRDLAARRRLAADHLERAKRALAATTDDGRSAMQEAGRALALDPSLPGAAELVGRLMLEPPAETPPEVAASLAADAARSQMEQARRGRIAALWCAAFLPGMWFAGVSDPTFYIVIALAVGAFVALTSYGARHPLAATGLPGRAVLTVVVLAVMLATLARLTSPFLIVPSIAALGITVLLGAPAYRNSKIVTLVLVAFIGAFIVPAALEVLGLVGRTFTLDEHALTIFIQASAPRIVGVWVALIACCVASVVVSAVATLRRARSEEHGQRLLHLQAWRLRQLLPPP
jgi:serine/threonine protein kinase